MTTPPAPAPVGPADMDAIYDGIPVAFYGDWSDLIVLGHHDPQCVAAAYRQHHQVHSDYPLGWTDSEMAAQVTHRWALFTRDDGDGDWEFTDTAAPHPGAVPVSFLAIG